MIKVQNLYVSFNKEFNALQNINFQIKDGERVSFLGSSGSGKTTLFRVLAGLEEYNRGEIFINGKNQKTISYENDISLAYIPFNGVFFNNKTVYENLQYVLKIRNVDPITGNIKINQALNDYNLVNLKDVKIKFLSKYQKILVQLARASLRKVDIFLIDNIFGKLSQSENEKIYECVKELIKERENSTFLIGTEDDTIAMAITTRSIKLEYGSIVEIQQY